MSSIRQAWLEAVVSDTLIYRRLKRDLPYLVEHLLFDFIRDSNLKSSLNSNLNRPLTKLLFDLAEQLYPFQ